jgi:hypothetical protein
MQWLMMKLVQLALVLSALTPTAPATSTSTDFHWQKAIGSGHTVEIKGINGTIEAEAASGDQVEVSATKEPGRHGDPAEVKIEAVEHDGGVTICAVYPSDDGRANECRPGKGGHMQVHDNDVKVNFTVRVPAGVQFVARTVNGGVRAQGLASEVEAYTVNGGIKVSTSGRGVAHTVNGGIEASLGTADGKEPLEFKTVNGSIKVELPAEARADLQGGTVNGKITSDFPVSVEGRPGTPKRLSGSIGGGGPLLTLETVNGSIQLTKSH